MKTKVISIALALSMLTSLTPIVSAIDTNGGTGEVSALVNQDASTFSVTLPTSLPISLSADGVVTTSNSAEIVNNSYGPVEITNIQVNPLNSWSIVNFSKDFKQEKVGIKEFGLTLNDDEVGLDGSVDLSEDSWVQIDGKGSLDIVYDANIATQKTALSNSSIANVVFTVGWSSTVSERPAGDISSSELAAMGLTFNNGEIKATIDEYTGNPSVSSDLVIPSSVDGVPVTSIGDDAFNYCGLTSVIIPDSIKIINDAAFRGNNFTTVKIPDGVTSIGKDAFNDCMSLTSINIPDGVTSLGGSCFCYTKISTLTIPKSVNSFGSYALDSMSRLTTINYMGSESDWNAIENVLKAGINEDYVTINYNYGS